MPVCDLPEEMSLNLKSRIVIFSIQPYRGGKLVKLVGEWESYDIGGLLTEGRKGLTPLMSIQELSGFAPWYTDMVLACAVDEHHQCLP